MLLLLAGFFWGLSEATLFFIVPDVLLSWIVLNQPDRVLVILMTTLTGALLGGCLLFYWGMYDHQQLLRVLDAIPAISPAQINSVSVPMQDGAFEAMLYGSFSGIPYKIYAAQAAGSNVDLPTFLLFSIPARLARWISIVLLTYAAKKILHSIGSAYLANKIWLLIWFTFYLVYFTIMPG